MVHGYDSFAEELSGTDNKTQVYQDWVVSVRMITRRSGIASGAQIGRDPIVINKTSKSVSRTSRSHQHVANVSFSWPGLVACARPQSEYGLESPSGSFLSHRTTDPDVL